MGDMMGEMIEDVIEKVDEFVHLKELVEEEDSVVEISEVPRPGSSVGSGEGNGGDV